MVISWKTILVLPASLLNPTFSLVTAQQFILPVTTATSSLMTHVPYAQIITKPGLLVTIQALLYHVTVVTIIILATQAVQRAPLFIVNVLLVIVTLTVSPVIRLTSLMLVTHVNRALPTATHVPQQQFVLYVHRDIYWLTTNV